MKKHLNWFLLLFIVTGMYLLTLSSCGTDEDEIATIELIPGNYTFEQAILQSAPKTAVGVTIPVPGYTQGADVTSQLKSALLGSAPCDNPEAASFILRDTREIFFGCLDGSGEVRGGTWTYSDDLKELVLNLSAPPLNTPITLKLEGFEVAENRSISGTIGNFPVPIGETLLFIEVFMKFDRAAD
ncbi:MAG: hypothetical protein JJU28_13965 [Cyclobacteriaceae bacterium]|nr:hypothetical protein [Cyclobacteriaceae bacterium]